MPKWGDGQEARRQVRSLFGLEAPVQPGLGVPGGTATSAQREEALVDRVHVEPAAGQEEVNLAAVDRVVNQRVGHGLGVAI